MNTINMKKNYSRRDNLLRVLMIFVGISGCFSVLFGAWLAHASQGLSVGAELSLTIALQYQFIHTLALFATLIWLNNITTPEKRSTILISASIGFVVGIVCFCGAIYIKTLVEFSESLSLLPTIFAKLTPLGGISFALSWLMLALETKNKF